MNKVLKVLLWLIRIYIGLIVIWAVSSWFGGIPAPIGTWLSYAMWPVLGLFGWAGLGGLNFGGVIALFVLFGLEHLISKRLAARTQT